MNSAPLRRIIPSTDVSIELSDYSSVEISAAAFFGVDSRDPQPGAARLAEQFLKQNRALLGLMGVTATRDYDGTTVMIRFQSSAQVGAIPLLSPTSARPDFGLIIQPRFPWSGVGPMLAEMGWVVVPQPLRLPLLRRSERRVPLWVLSAMVLSRMKALLDRMEHRFELTAEELPAPKGSVQWHAYATRNLPRARFLNVPCVYPDLSPDRNLKSAIRYTVEQHIKSLGSQRTHGGFVHQLVAFGEALLARVNTVPSRRPLAPELRTWKHRPFRRDVLLEGVEAIEWTVDERGLGGNSDLEALPWVMHMDAFFEAWVETVFRLIARRIGGALRVGRKRETLVALRWNPTFMNTQRTLVPDLIFETDQCTVIVDAKYKRHWEELQEDGWSRVHERLREEHRRDLLQVLAYANVAAAPRVLCCLIYPCSYSRWKVLTETRQLFYKAELQIQARPVDIWLTAIPMQAASAEIACKFAEELQEYFRMAELNTEPVSIKGGDRPPKPTG